MTHLYLIGGILLAVALGRNSLAGLFGAAIGTKMVRLRTAAILAAVAITLGALISGQSTVSGVLALAQPETLLDACLISSVGVIVFVVLSRFGLPVAVTQVGVGALVGWGFFKGAEVNLSALWQFIAAWVISPPLAAVIAWGLMKGLRWVLRSRAIPLFQRDWWIRVGLVCVGILLAYTLGANNLSAITGLYAGAVDMSQQMLVLVICAGVVAGCLTGSRRVIHTVSHGLFPLSPTEALASGVASALTLFLFTSTSLQGLLLSFSLPAFPLLPVPISTVSVGAIVGISLAKGGYGLNSMRLTQILGSWFLVPVMAGLICVALAAILSLGGIG